MDPTKEYLLLQELRFLCDAALTHGDRLRAIATEWSNIADTVAPPSGGPSGQRRLDTAEQNRRVERQQRRVQLQGEAFAVIDAFLSLAGRMTMIVFPKGGSQVRVARASAMARALQIELTHLLASKQLRNKWVHFDEVLDDVYHGDGERVTLQRFVMSFALAEERDRGAVRILALDSLVLYYRGVGQFDLTEMIQAVEDLAKRTRHAFETWSDRWPEILEE